MTARRNGIRTRRMAYSSETSPDFTLRNRPRVSRDGFSHLCAGAIALAFSVSVGSWILGVPKATLKVETTASSKPQSRAVPRTYGALLDPALTGIGPAVLADSAPLGAELAWASPAPPPIQPQLTNDRLVVPQVLPEVVENVPLPTPRPPELRMQASLAPARSASLPAHVRNNAPLASAPADNRTFFEKLFGMTPSSGPALAYATPEESLFGTSRNSPATPVPYDRYTAIYDIAAHTVYMPNGEKLEAHSGLGDKLDDPRHVNVRSRGATPPHIYDLQPRAQLFHGVQALRLNPVGSGGVFGRTGLLAHSYMLGPNGDSNGCVSFRDYQAFLHAYANGEVKRLAVVARMI